MHCFFTQYTALQALSNVSHPKDVHSNPVQAVGEDEDVGGRVGGLAEVEDHIYALEKEK